MLGVILLLAGLTAVFSEENICPPRITGSYCHCSQRNFPNGGGIKLICGYIEDPSTLLAEIQHYRGYKIHLLLLERLRVPYLPPGLFLGTSVKQLAIRHSLLDNLYSTKESSPSPFAGLEDSLEELGVYGTNQPSKWYWPDLSGMKLLKKIEIVDSPIDFVGHGFSEIGGGSLESITVAYSRVFRLHPQAFPELTNLKEVNFRGNFLPYVVRTMFADPAPMLRRIDLSDNKLFTLPENMFDNMPVLEFLDLSQNEFKTFQNLPAYNSLKSFYISKNPFECGCHMLALKKKIDSSTLERHDIKDVKCSRPGVYEKPLIRYILDEEFGC